MEGVDWYYIDEVKDNAETGPFDLAEMRILFKNGTITADTYIWHEQADGWLMVSKMLYEGIPVLSLIKPSEEARPKASDKLATRKQRVTANINSQIEEAKHKTEEGNLNLLLQNQPNAYPLAKTLSKQVQLKKRTGLTDQSLHVEDRVNPSSLVSSQFEQQLKQKRAIPYPSAYSEFTDAQEQPIHARLPTSSHLLSGPPAILSASSSGMSTGPSPLPGQASSNLFKEAHYKPELLASPLTHHQVDIDCLSKDASKEGYLGVVQTELQRKLNERTYKTLVNIEAQLEQHRHRLKEGSETYSESLLEPKTSFTAERLSAEELSRSSMPYASLDPKLRIKQLMKVHKTSDSDASEQSDSNSDNEQAQKEPPEASSHNELSSAEVWVEEITLEGHVYYRNETTSEVRWELPRTSQHRTFHNAWVWVPHSLEAYVPARLVESLGNGRVRIQKVGDLTATELSEAEAAKCLPLHKAELTQIVHVSSIQDLVQLGQPTDPLVLHNLRSRFLVDKIYTRIGSIIVAVNPFKPLPLYTEAYISKIRQK